MQKLTLLGVVFLAACTSACVFVVDGEGNWHSRSSHGWGGDSIAGSGRAITVEHTPAEFREVELNCAADVIITVGTSGAVRVTCDDNLVEHVSTTVDESVLSIDMEPGSYRFANHLIVELEVNALDRVALRGAGDVEIRGLAGGTLRLDIDGGGSVKAKGEVDQLEANVHGGGSMALFAVNARTANVLVAGAGEIELTVVEALDAKISGAGDVRYRGKPSVLKKSVTGAGSIAAD